ncbi:activating signal cointegrator 1 complex subunit 1-like [Tropilaelaps mercedesae]|uniref:Activating signal cointegrator 1 complex subunit 1-like n=1 Tax=Tropilaelaps mercedesae TaxID=418985 RepID=A0A1V9X996_9ACAR|nr:activating signal cointegrator 1 complex subunit 1-like [Tropilaelaps mercedesae]
MADCGVNPLRWDLKWIGENICYRLHPKVDPATRSQRPIEFTEEEMDGNSENDPDFTEMLDEPNVVAPDEIEKVRATLHVPDRYIGSVCGKQHSRRKEIEADTATIIRIPEKGSDDDIVILGDTHESVAECLSRLRTLIDIARSYEAVTHIISIPLAFDTVKKNLNEFRCLAIATSPALSERLFVCEDKLHLTVCCLCLQDEVELLQAGDVLLGCEDLVAKHLEEKPLFIQIRGLEIMNDDPDVVNVLYANIQEAQRNDTGRLQGLCDDVVQRFRESGLMVNSQASDREHLKLHMTLMNSKLAQEPNALVNPAFAFRNRRRTYDNVKPFSAKKILQTLGDQDFGVVQVCQMELNVISQVEPCTGYYRCMAKICFPIDAELLPTY